MSKNLAVLDIFFQQSLPTDDSAMRNAVDALFPGSQQSERVTGGGKEGVQNGEVVLKNPNL